MGDVVDLAQLHSPPEVMQLLPFSIASSMIQILRLTHEVLLEDTEQFTLFVTIIWVKEESELQAISVLSKLIQNLR